MSHAQSTKSEAEKTYWKGDVGHPKTRGNGGGGAIIYQVFATAAVAADAAAAAAMAISQVIFAHWCSSFYFVLICFISCCVTLDIHQPVH